VGLLISVAVAWAIAVVQVDYTTWTLDSDSFMINEIVEVHRSTEATYGFGTVHREAKLERVGGPAMSVRKIRPISTLGVHHGSLFLAWTPSMRDEWGSFAWSRRAAERYPEFDFIHASDDGFGFPAICLYTRRRADVDLDFGSTSPRVDREVADSGLRGGILIAKGSPSFFGGGRFWDRYLPLLPFWEGLLTNSAFYGVLAFGLARGFPASRALRRYRRGDCPKCGYDMRSNDSTLCPECGAGTRRRT